MIRLALAAAALALLVAAPAGAARFAVGVEAGADADALAARLAAATGGTVGHRLAPLGALTLEAPSAEGVAALPGVAYVERLDRVRRLSFAPNDPLAARQWHLTQTRVFDTWPEFPVPPLAPVRVAVVDSGLDAGHPEFAGRVVDAKSFVGGDPLVDEQGHGTFVAGLLGATVNNNLGIAGMAISAQLLVAKVVAPDGTIPLEAEVDAIRWAADRGARVINLSLGGVRDPLDPRRDTYSPLEAAAVAYAYRRGAVLVAAVGNADQSPAQPWNFASYPAALPHVVGVSASLREGGIAAFSNRDRIHNDMAAPGHELLSTLPRALTAPYPACANQGYSDCGGDAFRRAEGTSFAAPQVSAAAALMLALRPTLRPDQVTALLTRTAVDLAPASGCRECAPGRDALSGWGRLDVTAALAAARGKLPEADRHEPNDDAGASALRLWGAKGARLRATLDFWDDQSDVYAVRALRGQQLDVAVRGPTATRVFLWRPGTPAVEGLSVQLQRFRVAQSARTGVEQRLAYRVPPGGGGWYFVQVKLTAPGAGGYTLDVAKAQAPR